MLNLEQKFEEHAADCPLHKGGDCAGQPCMIDDSRDMYFESCRFDSCPVMFWFGIMEKAVAEEG